jgi:predicted metal-dependent phosphoesterase TrpH
MKIDLHIHTSTGSDGAFSIEEVFREAKKRNISLMSITDHDSIAAQEKAIILAKEYGIDYISGIELNVTFQYHPKPSKTFSLDFLGYQFDVQNQGLKNKLEVMRGHRETRAHQILEKLNIELDKENIGRLTEKDIKKIQESVDGTFGRPHIARYLVEKGIVRSNQEAFDRYLVRCDVPKYPLSLSEASILVRNAGGMLVLAHPNDPNGTSLVNLNTNLVEQEEIIKKYMLEYIDGIECWHSRHDEKTLEHYVEFARKNNLLITGGTDCHQNPVVMGRLDIPAYVAKQFSYKGKKRFPLFNRISS